MNVLVVGSDGYVGSVLVPKLLRKHVVAPYDIFGGQDIRDEKLFEKSCFGKDAIIYLAGITNNDECEKDPEQARRVNIKAFIQVVKIAELAGVKRFIFASSVAAYGSSDEEMNENHALNPSTLYGVGKAACEFALELSDIPHTITRSASVCGFSPRMRNDLTVNKMVHDAMTKRVITVNGGDQYRCHVHIEDLCDFYELLLKAPEDKIKGQVFNVVKRNESVKETAQTVAFIVGMTKVEFGPATDDRSYKASGTSAREILGWEPKRAYTDAVQDIIHGQSSG